MVIPIHRIVRKIFFNLKVGILVVHVVETHMLETLSGDIHWDSNCALREKRGSRIDTASPIVQSLSRGDRCLSHTAVIPIHLPGDYTLFTYMGLEVYKMPWKAYISCFYSCNYGLLLINLQLIRKINIMIITSTNQIHGYEITQYLGLINVNVVLGANFFSDFFASFTDVFGGYSSSYQSKLDKIYSDALSALTEKANKKGADAIVGVHFDFDELSGKGKSMFMVTAYGTAVNTTKIIEKPNKVGRYEVYDKLYNLAMFKEKGIITNEQYEEEKKNLHYRYKDDINEEIESIKSENIKEAIKQAQQEYQEKERLEALRFQEKNRNEEESNMSEKEKFALIRRNKQADIQQAIEDFKQKIPSIINVVRDLLANNVKDPRTALDSLTKSDVISASYSESDIDTSRQAAYNIGVFLKKERYAAGLKYYFDLVGDDDIDEAKSYLNSVYDILSFKNPTAFESMGKNLVELKVLGKEDEAVNEFVLYALCSREVAKTVVKLL